MAGSTVEAGTTPAAPTTTTTTPTSSQADRTAKQNEAMWVAAIVLGLYVVFVTVLVFMRGDANWDRLVYLLGGFEAIVFAAVGWIFGTTVSRGQVAAANETKDEAKQQAASARADAAVARQAETSARDGLLQASKDAERGKALAARLKSIGAGVAVPGAPRAPAPHAGVAADVDAGADGGATDGLPPGGDRELPRDRELPAFAPGAAPAAAAASGRSDLAELVDLAHRLFPDE